jgi:hypothetical protein
MQVAFESKGLKPDFHFIGSRFEIGRFQAMGKLDSTCIQPHRARGGRVPRRVAVQVAFGRAKFVTGFSRWVKGQAQGLEPGGFKLWVN